MGLPCHPKDEDIATMLTNLGACLAPCRAAATDMRHQAQAANA